MASTPSIITRFAVAGLAGALTGVRSFGAKGAAALSGVGKAGAAMGRSIAAGAKAAVAGLKGLVSVAGKAAGAVKAIGASAAGIGKAIAAKAALAGGALAGVGGLLAHDADDTAKRALDLQRFARAAGTGEKSFRNLAGALEAVGLAAEDGQQILGQLSQVMLDASKDASGDMAAQFRALGVEVTGANGEMRDTKAVLNELLAAVKKESPAKAAGILGQLFGDSDSAKVASLLDLTDAQIKKLKDSTQVLSRQQTALLRNMKVAQGAAKNLFDGLRERISLGSSGALAKFFDRIAASLKVYGPLIEGMATRFVGGMAGLGIRVLRGLEGLAGPIKRLFDETAATLSVVMPYIADATSRIARGAINFGTRFMQHMRVLARPLWETFDRLAQYWRTLGPQVENVFWRLVHAFVRLGPAAVDAFYRIGFAVTRLIQAIMREAGTLQPLLALTGKGIVDGVVSKIYLAIRAVRALGALLREVQAVAIWDYEGATYKELIHWRVRIGVLVDRLRELWSAIANYINVSFPTKAVNDALFHAFLKLYNLVRDLTFLINGQDSQIKVNTWLITTRDAARDALAAMGPLAKKAKELAGQGIDLFWKGLEIAHDAATDLLRDLGRLYRGEDAETPWVQTLVSAFQQVGLAWQDLVTLVTGGDQFNFAIFDKFLAPLRDYLLEVLTPELAIGFARLIALFGSAVEQIGLLLGGKDSDWPLLNSVRDFVVFLRGEVRKALPQIAKAVQDVIALFQKASEKYAAFTGGRSLTADLIVAEIVKVTTGIDGVKLAIDGVVGALKLAATFIGGLISGILAAFGIGAVGAGGGLAGIFAGLITAISGISRAILLIPPQVMLFLAALAGAGYIGGKIGAAIADWQYAEENQKSRDDFTKSLAAGAEYTKADRAKSGYYWGGDQPAQPMQPSSGTRTSLFTNPIKNGVEMQELDVGKAMIAAGYRPVEVTVSGKTEYAAMKGSTLRDMGEEARAASNRRPG